MRLGLALSLALALAVGALAGPAQGQTVQIEGSEPSGPSATPPLVLLEQTPWLSEGDAFNVRVAAAGSPEGATVALAVHDAVGSRSAFTGSLTGVDLGDDLASIPATPLAALPAAEAGGVRLTVPAEQVAQLDGGGVYPVDIVLAGPDGAVLHRLVTHLIRVPGQVESPPLSVAVVVPIDAAPTLEADGAVEVDPATRLQVATVGDALLEYPTVPLTLDPSPETIDSLARTGDPAAETLLRRLARGSAGRQVLGGTWADLDVPSWVHTSLGIDPLAEQLAAGSAAVDEHLEVRADRRTWVFDGPTTPQALARLAALGVDQVVIPDSGLVPLDANVFPVALTQPFEVETATGDLARAASADGGLTSHLGSTGDPVLDAQHLLADLSVLYFDRPALTRGVTVPLQPEVEIPPAFLSTLLDALGQPQRVLQPVTVDRLFAAVPDAGAGGEADTSGVPLVRPLTPAPLADLGSYPDDIALTRLTLAGYGSLVGPTEPQTLSLERLTLTSGDRAFDDSERSAYLAEVSNQIDATIAAIDAPEDQTITLTARNGTIPLRIVNGNSVPASVLIQLESERLEFPDGDRLEVTLPPGETTLDIRVETRASGAFPLDAAITSPDGLLDVTGTEYRVRSTALSGVGVVISIGAGLILLVWWLRHFRTLRRNRALVGSAAGDRTPPEPTPETRTPDAATPDAATSENRDPS
jgi:hypothetical protein